MEILIGREITLTVAIRVTFSARFLGLTIAELRPHCRGILTTSDMSSVWKETSGTEIVS